MKNSFEDMSRAQQRVAIAKDVLAQLKLKKYKAEAGVYVHVQYNGSKWLAQDLNVKKNLRKMKSCTVCAIGSCIVSATRLGNVLNFEQMERESHPETKRVLAKYFTQKQLYLMESAFEQTQSALYSLTDDGDEDSFYVPSDKIYAEGEFAKVFGMKFKTDTARLKAIMENIVKNKGTFKPKTK